MYKLYKKPLTNNCDRFTNIWFFCHNSKSCGFLHLLYHLSKQSIIMICSHYIWGSTPLNLDDSSITHPSQEQLLCGSIPCSATGFPSWCSSVKPNIVGRFPSQAGFIQDNCSACCRKNLVTRQIQSRAKDQGIELLCEHLLFAARQVHIQHHRTICVAGVTKMGGCQVPNGWKINSKLT